MSEPYVALPLRVYEAKVKTSTGDTSTSLKPPDVEINLETGESKIGRKEKMKAKTEKLPIPRAIRLMAEEAVPIGDEKQLDILLHQLSQSGRFECNDEGQVTIDGKFYPNSALFDLVSCYFRNVPDPKLAGYKQFLDLITDIGLHPEPRKRRNYVEEVTEEEFPPVPKKKRTESPTKKKTTPAKTPANSSKTKKTVTTKKSTPSKAATVKTTRSTRSNPNLEPPNTTKSKDRNLNELSRAANIYMNYGKKQKGGGRKWKNSLVRF